MKIAGITALSLSQVKGVEVLVVVDMKVLSTSNIEGFPNVFCN